MHGLLRCLLGRWDIEYMHFDPMTVLFYGLQSSSFGRLDMFRSARSGFDI